MNEQMNKFDELFAKMSASKNVEDMKLFGMVMREMFKFISERMPDKAEEYLEQLCAIKWENYLTKKEAEEIVLGMEPKPKWTKEQVKSTLDAMGFPHEEMPYYNWCSLYTTISMISSDSGETINKYAFGINTTGTADEDAMFELIYHLAIDKLKDKDKKFNIRKYFGLW